MKGSFFVAAQIAILIGLFFHSGFLAEFMLGRIIQLIALFLALWILFHFPMRQFKIHPKPSLGGRLICKGPYRFVRHPMYSALLLYCSGLVIDEFNWISLVLVFGLLVLIKFKLDYEEKQLEHSYSEYADYKKTTKRLIPYLY